MTLGMYSQLNNPWMNMGMSALGMFGGGCDMFGMSGMSYGNIFTASGCFGGGYGMGGFGGYCDTNYDAMAGYAVGMSLMNVLGMAISSTRAQNMAEKQAREKNEQNITDIKKQIKEKQEELDSEDWKIASKYDSNIEAAEKAVTEVEEKIDTKQGELDKLNGTGEGSISAKQTELDAIDKNAEPAKYEKVEKELKALKDKAEALEKEIAKHKDEDLVKANKKVEEAKEAKEKAIEARRDKLNDEIDSLKEKLSECKDKQQEDLSNQISVSKKCDTDAEFEAINSNENATSKDYKRAFNFAFSKFHTAADDKTKSQYAVKGLEIYNKMSETDKTKTMVQAARTMNEWKTNHKENED